MKTLEQHRGQLKTVADIRSVVATMKTLAAARIRQFESVANATQSYIDNLELALQILLQHHHRPTTIASAAHPDASVGVILLGTDQGFCGRFNANIVETFAKKFLAQQFNQKEHQFSNRFESPYQTESQYAPAAQPSGSSDKPDKLAADSRADSPNSNSSPSSTNPRILCMGAKLNILLQARGIQPNEVFAAPSSVNGVNSVVHELLRAIICWQDTHAIEVIHLVFNQRRRSAEPEVFFHQLLPLDAKYLNSISVRPWQSNSLPALSLPWAGAFSSVIRQWLFIQVYRSVAESLASENFSRIAAMQQAESNIDRRYDELKSSFNHARQQIITDELRDIIGGFEAGSRRKQE